jgi:hypothetical protein
VPFRGFVGVDSATSATHTLPMTVSPLPLRGGVQLDLRDEGRALRVSAHPESDSVILSIWRRNECVATHHVRTADVPDLIKVLADALVAPVPEARKPPGNCC